MIVPGMEARCDRCGNNKFYPDGGIIARSERIRMDGWEVRLGKTLCPDCAAAFDKLTEQFFNEIWDK